MGQWGPCGSVGSVWSCGVCIGLWGLYGTMGSMRVYGVRVGLWGLHEAMGSMRGYGVCIGLWGLHGAMGSMQGYGVCMGLWSPCGAMGSIWDYGVCMGLWSPCGAMGSIWDYGVCMGLWGRCVVPPLSLMGPTIRGCCSLWGAELQGPLQRRPGGTPFVSYRVSQSALFVVVGSPLCLLWGLRSVMGSPLCYGVSALLWGLRSVMGFPGRQCLPLTLPLLGSLPSAARGETEALPGGAQRSPPPNPPRL